MTARRPLIAGNWKMFGRRADLAQLPATLERAGPGAAALDVLFCVPAPLIAPASETGLLLGAQDCAEFAKDAAKTGDVSAAMLADAGAKYVILGHSERRAGRGETDALVRQKAEAAIGAGLIPIVCVGETKAERAEGRALAVVAAQLDASIPDAAPETLVVAYEPVWCIGGDRTPTNAEIAEMHSEVRRVSGARFGAAWAEKLRVLYGGSVNPMNAGEIFSIPGVDGALVGRASLNAADFAALIAAHPAVAQP